MSRVARRVGVAVATLALSGGASTVVAPAVSGQGTDPVVVLDRTGTAAGETMLVTGQRWPEAATVIVQLCGHGGLRGTVDCDVANQRTAGVGPSGKFSVELTAALPPVPCPCVVKATDQSTQVSATAPIAVAGIPTVPLSVNDVPRPRSVEISSIRIKGGQRVTELFGAGGRRVLEFALVNTGPVAVDAPRVSIAWGRGANPDGFVKPPRTSPLEPGQTETYSVPLERPALTLGSQTAVVEVQGIGAPIVASAKTSGYPWGLLAIALVVLQLLLLRIRNRVRRRIAPSGDAKSPPQLADPPEVAGTPATGHVPSVSPLLAASPPGRWATGAPSGAPSKRSELIGAVLELSAAPPALASASAWGGAVAPQLGEAPPAEQAREVIDLSAADRVDQALGAEIDVGVNGSSSSGRGDGTAVPEPSDSALLDDVAAARAEVVELRRQAQTALDRARELAEGCTQATEGRVRDIEDRARATLRAAEASRTESVEALVAAKARAEELLDDATVAADALSQKATAELQQVTADRDAARAALEEMRRERTELLDAAMEAVEEVLREIDDRAQQLADEIARRAAAAAEVDVEPLRRRVPRIDDLDGRLADAISRAFASVRSDHTSTD